MPLHISWYLSPLCFCLIFCTGSHCVFQAGLQLTAVFLPQPPERWERCVPSCVNLCPLLSSPVEDHCFSVQFTFLVLTFYVGCPSFLFIYLAVGSCISVVFLEHRWYSVLLEAPFDTLTMYGGRLGESHRSKIWRDKSVCLSLTRLISFICFLSTSSIWKFIVQCYFKSWFCRSQVMDAWDSDFPIFSPPFPLLCDSVSLRNL